MTSRTILLVDDDKDLSDALIEQLSLYDEFDLQHEATATAGITSPAEPPQAKTTVASRRGSSRRP